MALLARRRIIPAAMAALFLFLQTLTASAANAPVVISEDIRVFRNLVVAGDLFVMYEYALPLPDWTGTGTGAALVRLLDTSTTPATVLQERQAPAATGWTLTGFYLETGHGIAWQSTDLQAAVISNPTSWDTLETDHNDATLASYITTTGVTVGSDDNSDIVCAELKTLLRDIESKDANVNQYDLVNISGFTTDDALTMAQGMIPNIADILQTCFTVGKDSSGIAFDPNAGVLGDNLQVTVEGTDAWTRWEAFTTDAGFTSASIAAVMLAFVATIVVGLVAFALSSSIQYAMGASALIFLGSAMMVPGSLLQGAFLLLAALWVALGIFVFQRIPR
jgi:hypothetical protein